MITTTKKSTTVSAPTDGRRASPSPDCQLCPRLVAYRRDNRATEPTWHNAPVVSCGEPTARLLIVGLAPGRSGANRTGRPFNGDVAGDVLYAALARHGFARRNDADVGDDGFEPVGCRITNAVRCVPPANKPNSAEVSACRPFLVDELKAVPAPEVVLCLGRIANQSCLRALGLRPSAHAFAHGRETNTDGGPTLVASYHTSRYNTNTGRLTAVMFEAVISRVRQRLAH